MKWTLRKAQAGDFEAINALFTEMLRTVSPADHVQGYAPGDLDRFFSGGEDWICVAEIGGKIVGFLSIEVHRGSENFLYYDDFSVTSAYRNQGIGASLTAEAEEFAKSISISTIVLHVEKTNLLAQRFYKRTGFSLYRDETTRLRLIKYLPG